MHARWKLLDHLPALQLAEADRALVTAGLLVVLVRREGRDRGGTKAVTVHATWLCWQLGKRRSWLRARCRLLHLHREAPACVVVTYVVDEERPVDAKENRDEDEDTEAPPHADEIQHQAGEHAEWY